MKLVSALQLGTTCQWRWSGHAGAGDAPEVHADVEAVRGYLLPERLHGALHQTLELEALVIVELLEVSDVAVRDRP